MKIGAIPAEKNPPPVDQNSNIIFTKKEGTLLAGGRQNSAGLDPKIKFGAPRPNLPPAENFAPRGSLGASINQGADRKSPRRFWFSGSVRSALSSREHCTRGPSYSCPGRKISRNRTDDSNVH